MQGIIFLWYGSILSIPDGWALCDGTQGTPNLAGKFVPCAGDTYNPGDNEPLGSHYHDFTSDDHDHAIPSDSQISAGADYDNQTYIEAAIGTVNGNWPRPPYHVLAYIMKLP